MCEETIKTYFVEDNIVASLGLTTQNLTVNKEIDIRNLDLRVSTQMPSLCLYFYVKYFCCW